MHMSRHRYSLSATSCFFRPSAASVLLLRYCMRSQVRPWRMERPGLERGARVHRGGGKRACPSPHAYECSKRL